MDFSINFSVDFKKSHCFDSDGNYLFIDGLEEDLVTLYADILDDDENKLGNIIGYYAINDGNFLENCDAVSGDCCVIAETVCDYKTGAVHSKFFSEKNFLERIFILDQIVINKEHRGKGIASKILKNLPEILNNQFNDEVPGFTIFLCASAIEKIDFGFDSKEYKVDTERLIRFYERFGYKKLKNNVMYLKN